VQKHTKRLCSSLRDLGQYEHNCLFYCWKLYKVCHRTSAFCAVSWKVHPECKQVKTSKLKAATETIWGTSVVTQHFEAAGLFPSSSDCFLLYRHIIHSLILKGSDDGVLGSKQWFVDYVHRPILKTHNVPTAVSAFIFRCG
jgi:hypothetical protein